MQIEQYMTVAQVAEILAVSHDTVLRQFGSMRGVIDVGTPETLHKRKRRELRISRGALDTYVASKQVTVRKAGR